LKDEIPEYLRREALAVFRVEPEMWPGDRAVWWDTDRAPDYREFVASAKAAGIRMMLYFDEDLTENKVADVEDALELARVEPAEFREYSRRIAELRSYLGFTGRVSLGFTLDGFFFWYEMEAPWYEDLQDLLEELHLFGSGYAPVDAEDDDEDDDKEPPMGGFYSRN